MYPSNAFQSVQQRENKQQSIDCCVFFFFFTQKTHFFGSGQEAMGGRYIHM